MSVREATGTYRYCIDGPGHRLAAGTKARPSCAAATGENILWISCFMSNIKPDFVVDRQLMQES